jgi:type VII secretion protein EccB
VGTNKDQAQSYRFMLQRVTSALTVHETDPEQPPFRRPVLAAIGGIVIAALVMVGFWVFGLIVPGGERFSATDVIAVEEETGARYVLLNGKLHPVLNYSSALLALDKHAAVEMVPRESLAGIPVGPPIGIPDAPDSLPGTGQLLTGGWSMCDESTVDEQGRRRDSPVLLVGQPPDRAGTPREHALLVHSDNRIYVIHEGYRHEIADGVQVALDLNKETAATVSGSWLDTIPVGKPIGPLPLADAGRPTTLAVPGVTLLSGQLLEVGGAADSGVTPTYYLVTGDQLQSISPLQAVVQGVLGPHANPPVKVDNRAMLNAVRAEPRPPTEDDPPTDRPTFLTVNSSEVTVCATFEPGATVPSLVVNAALPASIPDAPAGEIRVAVPPGQAAVIEVMASPSEPPGQGTLALVTDQGRLYPLAEPNVLAVLGLDGATPVRITAVLADRVPKGQSLSPEAARTPVTGN